jgi:hypothetical protein
MSIVKLNNRSVKDITAFGSITSLGSLSHISTQTASSSASLSFTSGIDSSFKEYVFYFVNIHGATDDAEFQVGFRDGGSDYDATKTSSNFRAYHFESDSGAGVGYQTTRDLAQSTSFQSLGQLQSSQDNDSCGVGYLHLFNPSSTTFVKHYIAQYSHHYTYNAPGVIDNYTAGYCNVTAAIDGVQFKMNSGNIDSGQILLFGLN